MRPIFAWLIGLFNIAVVAVFSFFLPGDWDEFRYGDYARAYSGSCLLDVIIVLGAVGTCGCLVLGRGEGSLFQRAVAWGLLLRFVWDCLLDNFTLGERFALASDWPGILIWSMVIALALYSSRSLRRSRLATTRGQSDA